MKSFFLVNIFFLIAFIHCIGQPVLVNNGSIISNTNGNSLSVSGDITNLTNGQFENYGSFYFTGNWTNNAGNNAFTNVSQGRVIMNGSNQSIQGTDVTSFYTLTLSGTGIKQLNSIDATIKDSFNLNDREFATNTNSVFITNTNPNLLSFTSGFVSSLGSGALIRNTASTSAYLFPVGSSIGSTKFRPVEITPSSNAPHTFAVRLANTDATLEGFNRNSKEPNLGNIIPSYYFRIRRNNGTSPADITTYFDPLQDGEIKGIAHWQNTPQWENINANSVTNNFGLNTMQKMAWNDFSYDAFAFYTSECGNLFVPNAFSPNNDGLNDVLRVKIKEDCVSEFNLLIYDRWGEKVFESKDISIVWDGTYKGKKLDDAVFVYYLSIKLVNQTEVISQTGNISLVN